MKRFRVYVLISLMLGAMGLGCAQPRRTPVASHVAGPPVDAPFLVNVDESGLALQGYDPVAYFAAGKPVRGSAAFESVYRGAKYRFSSAENRATFERTPEKYEPQFGGFCAYAASINRVSPISVEFWEIVDGRLLLQHNQKAWDLWHQAPAASLVNADRNWPGLVATHGNQ